MNNVCDGCSLDITYARNQITGRYEWVHLRTGEPSCHPGKSCGCLAEPR